MPPQIIQTPMSSISYGQNFPNKTGARVCVCMSHAHIVKQPIFMFYHLDLAIIQVTATKRKHKSPSLLDHENLEVLFFPCSKVYNLKVDCKMITWYIDNKKFLLLFWFNNCLCYRTSKSKRGERELHLHTKKQKIFIPYTNKWNNLTLTTFSVKRGTDKESLKI